MAGNQLAPLPTSGGPDESSAHFAALRDVIIRAAGIGMWDWHLPSGRVIYSAQWEQILGYAPGELPQTVLPWEGAIVPEDRQRTFEAVDRFLAQGDGIYEAEFRMLRKDGVEIWAQDRGYVAERDAQGNPVRVIGILQEITRLKRAEERLQQKSEQLDFVAHISGLASWCYEAGTGRITYSEELLAMLGYREGELGGTVAEWEGLIHLDDLAEVRQALEMLAAGDEERHLWEVRLRRRAGDYLWTRGVAQTVERGPGGS